MGGGGEVPEPMELYFKKTKTFKQKDPMGVEVLSALDREEQNIKCRTRIPLLMLKVRLEVAKTDLKLQGTHTHTQH